jgi:hypothetical protein
MALNADELATLMDSKFPPLTEPNAAAERLKGLKAIAEAVVEHIKAKAEIKMPTNLASVPGTAGGPLVLVPGQELAFPPGAID